MSDPGVTYRDKIEVGEIWKSVDPITLLKKVILDNNVMDQDGLSEIDS